MNKPIGQIIKEVFETSGISKQEFGDRIYCSRQNVYSIFQKKNIDIGLLRRISDVLNYDFFAYLSEDGKKGTNEETVYYFGRWITMDEYKQIMNREEKVMLEKMSKKVNAYMSSKARTPYYEVSFNTEYDSDYPELIPLTPKDVKTLREGVLEGEEELIYLIDWTRYVSEQYQREWGVGELYSVNSVDFTPRYLYRFTCCEMESPTDKPLVYNFSVEMDDEMYSRLLIMLMQNRRLTTGYLRKTDLELYKKIYDGAYNPRCGMDPLYPYVVFLTEPNKDVENMIGERNRDFDLCDGCLPNGGSFHIHAYLENKELIVRFFWSRGVEDIQDWPQDTEEHSAILQLVNVDESKIQRPELRYPISLVHERMGTSCFKDVENFMTAHFSTEDAYERIKDFMEA